MRDFSVLWSQRYAGFRRVDGLYFGQSYCLYINCEAVTHSLWHPLTNCESFGLNLRRVVCHLDAETEENLLHFKGMN